MKKLINHIFLISLTTICFSTNNQEEAYNAKIISLQNSSIKNIIPMQEHLKSKQHKVEFEGKVYFVTLNDSTKAVFKDLSDSLDDAYAEVAAFKASQFLGFPNVPPTAIRTINDKLGTLQLYIEPTVDATIPGIYEDAF